MVRVGEAQMLPDDERETGDLDIRLDAHRPQPVHAERERVQHRLHRAEREQPDADDGEVGEEPLLAADQATVQGIDRAPQAERERAAAEAVQIERRPLAARFDHQSPGLAAEVDREQQRRPQPDPPEVERSFRRDRPRRGAEPQQGLSQPHRAVVDDAHLVGTPPPLRHEAVAGAEVDQPGCIAVGFQPRVVRGAVLVVQHHIVVERAADPQTAGRHRHAVLRRPVALQDLDEPAHRSLSRKAWVMRVAFSKEKPSSSSPLFSRWCTPSTCSASTR